MATARTVILKANTKMTELNPVWKDGKWVFDPDKPIYPKTDVDVFDQDRMENWADDTEGGYTVSEPVPDEELDDLEYYGRYGYSRTEPTCSDPECFMCGDD